MSVRRSREPNLVTASTPHLQSVKALFKRNPLAAALSTGGFPLRASPSTFEDSGRDGREAEGTGLLNRHTWKRVSRVRIPLSPLGGSAHRTRFSLPHADDHCQTQTSLRSFADRLSPRRRRAHRAVQLALRQKI